MIHSCEHDKQYSLSLIPQIQVKYRWFGNVQAVRVSQWEDLCITDSPLSCSTSMAGTERPPRLRTVGEGIEALHQLGIGYQLAQMRQNTGSGIVMERERRTLTLKKLCQ